MHLLTGTAGRHVKVRFNGSPSCYTSFLTMEKLKMVSFVGKRLSMPVPVVNLYDIHLSHQKFKIFLLANLSEMIEDSSFF